LPDTTPPDGEFYDYNPATTNNTAETGKDCFNASSALQAKVRQYTQVMGSWEALSTGLSAVGVSGLCLRLVPRLN
jgi:hypothetical protein